MPQFAPGKGCRRRYNAAYLREDVTRSDLMVAVMGMMRVSNFLV
jgi:hypothetical protein